MPLANNGMKKNHLVIKGNNVQDILQVVQEWNIVDDPHIVNALNFFGKPGGVSTRDRIQRGFLHVLKKMLRVILYQWGSLFRLFVYNCINMCGATT